MASPSYKSAPSTPSKTATTPTPTPTPTGSWRHPAMDIVAKRNSQKAFTDTTSHRLMLNGIALFLCWFVVAIFKQSSTLTRLAPTSPNISFYAFYALWAIRCLLSWNILESLYKLIRPADEFTDIPLTPEQRKLLGLNPDTPLSASASAASIITPPRYTKSTPSSRTGSPIAFNTSASSPTMARKAAATPPMTTSPLHMGGAADRRGSFGSPSPAGPRVGSSVVPSPKWLYEKNQQKRGMLFSPRPSYL